MINTLQDAIETAIKMRLRRLSGVVFRSWMETVEKMKCGDWAYPCRDFLGILSFDAPNAANRLVFFRRPASACFVPRQINKGFKPERDDRTSRRGLRQSQVPGDPVSGYTCSAVPVVCVCTLRVSNGLTWWVWNQGQVICMCSASPHPRQECASRYV